MKSQGSQKKKVFVGVSGGVDSSVAAALLKEQGHDVTGVFLKVWSPDFLLCTWRDERRSAMRVCAQLGIPFLTLDCEEEYKKSVVDYMITEYKAGRTPNPDILCNKEIKFGVFLKKALELGADYIATGHYAIGDKKTNELKESADKEKDQSYFLSQLNSDQISHALFPIGHLQKSAVRKLAEKFDLPTAEKKDSQGLCFIGKVDMKEFLSHYISVTPGDVLNTQGEVIGYHDGVLFYTVGERHGFTITKKGEHDPRLFVLSKNMEDNTITVGEREISNQESPRYNLQSMNWISGIAPDLSKIYGVRFRYRQEKQKCKIVAAGDSFSLIPQYVQFGIAPGQSAVIYDGEVCLGGGIIC